jgi:hypothetical protein
MVIDHPRPLNLRDLVRGWLHSRNIVDHIKRKLVLEAPYARKERTWELGIVAEIHPGRSIHQPHDGLEHLIRSCFCDIVRTAPRSELVVFLS